VSAPSPADPEIAAATLSDHLNALWSTGEPVRREWRRRRLDELRWVVELPARTAEGGRFSHHARLDGRWYDTWPPDVAFVDPETDQPVSAGRWLPTVQVPPDSRFAVHATYPFPDGTQRQLVCFSFTLGYYESVHPPSASQAWTRGRHTVAATLYRLAEMLAPPHYRGPAG